MTTVAEVMRRLDAAAAEGLRHQIAAKEAQIGRRRAEQQLAQAREEIAELKSRMHVDRDTATELIKLVDLLRADRDNWRAIASAATGVNP